MPSGSPTSPFASSCCPLGRHGQCPRTAARSDHDLAFWNCSWQLRPLLEPSSSISTLIIGVQWAATTWDISRKAAKTAARVASFAIECPRE
ncbi:AAI domain-containing protein [Psidium guajava]|nr:AAI domain-containing protein [Psidium guajava]